MSGLLERIARRRRAPLSGWLGQAQKNGSARVNGSAAEQPPAANGAMPAPGAMHALQLADTASAERAPAAEDRLGDDQVTTELSAVKLPPPEPEPAETSFTERGRLRRRARYLRRLREVQLRDIGGFMVELHRFGRQRPDLVEAKVQGASQVDLELKSLERTLGEQPTLRELREAGIGGACGHCGAVHGSEDNFCAACGASLRTGSKAPENH
ncbi:MAG: zinc ribbon domain-containing protein [Solirubrobacterales bacterium]|nr:zinc ribbon domain-containing protein [Solirubrobacterales bacterium]